MDRMSFAVDDHGHRTIVGSGGLHYLRDSGFNGFQVGGGDLIGEALEAGLYRYRFPEDQVGANALDLNDDVAFAGERYGDHQNDAGAADDYAEHRQHGAEFVGTEGLQRQPPRLAH